MGPLFAYSLMPVVAVSLLLCFTALLRGRNAVGLAIYCGALAAWSGALLLMAIPATAAVGDRVATMGTFTAAGYLHAAYDLTRQRSYRLVGFAYLCALGLTLLGAAFPGILFHARAMAPGPLFWPSMALAVAAATVPLYTLARAYPEADPGQRRLLRDLGLAGVLAYGGALSNAVLLSHGHALPFGLYVALAGLLVLANVVRAHEPPAERRLLERSLLYSALTAFLSAGFLFGVLSWAGEAAPLVRQYRLGAVFLMALAALALEPVRTQFQEWLGRLLFRDRAPAADVARALVAQETRADQAARLAELGAFVSAVAHEVRNPLGVLAAHLKLLERSGAPAEQVEGMREQIERASRFVDDLLRYGKPRPLELRLVDVNATLELAASTARQGLGPLAPEAQVEVAGAAGAPLVEADQAQLTQLLVVLVENALLALAAAPERRLRLSSAVEGERVRIQIDDSGPGIPEAIRARLFQPFVTGRGRESARPGTGLGLAIARAIAERHGGRLSAGRSPLGGARFELELPRTQPVLAAAAGGGA